LKKTAIVKVLRAESPEVERDTELLYQLPVDSNLDGMSRQTLA